MVKRFLSNLLVAMLMFLAIIIASFVFLKWWQALLVVIVMIACVVVVMRYLTMNIGEILVNAAHSAFKLKVQALRGAEVQVHEIQPVEAPPDDIEAQLAFYQIDLTITPSASAGGVSYWDIDDIRLVPMEMKPPDMQEAYTWDNVGRFAGYKIQNVQVLINGGYVPDPVPRLEGPQQLRLLVALPPELREVKFQYFTEQFGHFVLPGPSAPPNQPQLP